MALSKKQLEAAFQRTVAQREKFVGGGGNYQTVVKLNPGYTRLRHIVDKGNQPFVLFRRQERWANDRPSFYIDLRFVFEDEQMLELFRDKLSDQDYRLFQEFGDPWVTFFRNINPPDTEWEKAVHKWLLPKTVIEYAVGLHTKDGYEFGILTRGPQYHEELMKLVVGVTTTDGDGNEVTIEPKAPDLFDEQSGSDVEIIGNEKPKLERRYNPPSPLAPGPIEVPDEDRPDLVADIGRQVVGWSAKWEALRKKFSDDDLEKYGLGPQRIQKFLRGEESGGES